MAAKGKVSKNFDFIGIDYHGNCQSHIDALFFGEIEQRFADR